MHRIRLSDILTNKPDAVQFTHTHGCTYTLAYTPAYTADTLAKTPGHLVRSSASFTSDLAL